MAAEAAAVEAAEAVATPVDQEEDQVLLVDPVIVVGDDRTANLKVDNITNRTGTDGTEVDGIVEVNTTAHFIPPSGTTAERGSRGRGVFMGGRTPSLQM